MVRRVIRRALLPALVFAAPWLAEARRVELRIIHTTDLHSHVVPTVDYEGATDVGGVLRAATLIRELKSSQPNHLLVDCGDLFQGTPEGLLTGGRVMIRYIEHMAYDAWTLGNHEFDWGLANIATMVASTRVPVLGANVRALPGTSSPMPGIRPYIVREIDGVRVAIVGLNTPGIPSWSLPDQLGTLEFRGSVETLREILPKVRDENPDLVVVTAHQGHRDGRDDFANEVNAIAAAFPEIDVILGGHSHRPVEHVLIGNILYSQAGYHGIWVGHVDIAYDTVARRVIRKEAKLVRAGPEVPKDAALAELLREEIEQGAAYRSARLGEAADDLASELNEQGESAVQQILARAILEGVDADVVLHGRLSEEVLRKGPITREDLWRIVPYENRVGILHLTPRQLAAVLEENETRRGSISFMGCLGVSFDVERDADGRVSIDRIRTRDGEPVHPRKRLRVAVNSYVLASGGQRFPTVRRLFAEPEVAAAVIDVDTRTLVEDFIKKHSPLRAADLEPRPPPR